MSFWGWLTGGRKRHAAILAEAEMLIEQYGVRARYAAIELARPVGDGLQVEEGKTADFWWQVVIEIDRQQGRTRLDTATRYQEE